MVTIKVLLLLFAGCCVISTGEDRVLKNRPRIEEVLDILDLNRLTDGWRRAVTEGCADDVASFLTALDNGTLWANKSEYDRASLWCGQNVNSVMW
jgi:hypothetical protein